MMHKEERPFADLRDYVERKGLGPGPKVRTAGWLLRDLSMLLTEYDRLRGAPPVKKKRTWAEAWGIFDWRKDRGR